jgi:hypothetical protein
MNTNLPPKPTPKQVEAALLWTARTRGDTQDYRSLSEAYPGCMPDEAAGSILRAHVLHLRAEQDSFYPRLVQALVKEEGHLRRAARFNVTKPEVAQQFSTAAEVVRALCSALHVTVNRKETTEASCHNPT